MTSQTRTGGKELKSLGYVFIITYARSGSTLLQAVLNSTPGVVIRGENGGVLFHLFKAVDAARATARRGRGKLPQNPDRPWFGAGDVRPQALRKALVASFVRTVLNPPEDARVTGFKEIRHTPFFMSDDEFAEYVAFLLDSFPASRVVFNSRDATSVSRSGWLKQRNPERVIRDVQACDRRFAAALARHPERCFHVQYEDFVADPGRYAELFGFLDLPWDADRVKAVLEKPLTHAKGAPDHG